MWPFGKNAKARLEDALDEQKLTSDLDLDVQVEKKVARLSGEVPHERYKNLIKAIASGINGIDDVDLGDIRVVPGGTGGQVATGSMESMATEVDDPSALAKAALKAIKSEPGLADDPIDVLQSGTTVVVRGAVDSAEEHERLRQLVTSVPGVSALDDSGLNVVQHAAQLNATDDDGDVVYTVKDVVYTVKSGDTLSHIALKYYGAAGRDSYMRIAEANDISDPNKIQVGQKLKIPGTPQGPDAVV